MLDNIEEYLNNRHTHKWGTETLFSPFEASYEALLLADMLNNKKTYLD
jgi:hypothetical protein